MLIGRLFLIEMNRAFSSISVQVLRFVLFLLISSLSSCIGLARYSGYVDNSVRRITTTDMEPDSNLSFTGPTLNENQAWSKTRTTGQAFVPALLFWYGERNFQTTFDEGLVANLFQAQLKDQAEKQGITKALGSRKLILEAVDVPDDFSYSKNFTVVYLLLAALSQQTETLEPSKKSPILRYRLLSDTTELMQGKVLGKNVNNEPIAVLPGQTQKSLNEFIDSYQLNLRLLAMEMIKDLKTLLKVHLTFPNETQEQTDR